MKRYWLGLAAAAAVVAVPAAASAYAARVVANVNLRACASTGCAPIIVLPAGATVNVLSYVGGWNYVTYAGYAGYAAANYIEAGYTPPRPPVVQPYPVYPYPVYPQPYTYPYYYRPGFSFNFTFGDR